MEKGNKETRPMITAGVQSIHVEPQANGSLITTLL